MGAKKSLASGLLLSVGVLATSALHARPARADIEIQLAAAGGATWVRATPSLSSEALTTFSRNLRASQVSGGASVVALGGFFDLGLSIDDRWVLPLVGLGGYGTVGNYDPIVTGVDGSIARLRPWTTTRADILLPGIGYRMKRRRFMFGAVLRTGASVYDVNGSVADGPYAYEVGFSTVRPMVQLEVEACRRLDPATRLCLQVSPRIYDGELLNGAIFGLRVEWGR